MEKKEVKKCKKRLNILEIAATDKENFTSKIHKKKLANSTKTSLAKRNLKSSELNNKNSTQTRSSVYITKTDQSTQSVSNIEADLTVDNPSDKYWQDLAESCRRALETALKENVDLHNKVNELEYENNKLKEMLDEAKSLVEVLTEMIQDSKNETKPTEKDDSVLFDAKGATSDSEVEDVSFQSCL